MNLVVKEIDNYLVINRIAKILVFLLLLICVTSGFFSYRALANTKSDSKDDTAADTKLDEQSEENRNIPKDGDPRYVIYVNKQLNCVTIYWTDSKGVEIPVKTMICSCGKNGRTPEGTYKTSDYYEWRNMIDGSWGKYAVRFNGMVLFHSVPYRTKSSDNLEWDQYNLLGTSASLGCVRLTVEDAKWIYDHCKKGTKVVVYSDDEVKGPWEIPKAQKINEYSSYRGWDPTDPDEDNPWNKNKKKKSNTNTNKKD